MKFDPKSRLRTVSPNTSPNTLSAVYPGRSFMVETSTGYGEPCGATCGAFCWVGW